MSVYETLRHMLGNGWTLEKKASKDAKMLSFQQGQARVFYTPGVTVTKPYLMALLHADVHVGVAVPRGREAK
eukprot:5191101-Lingulodinium_polyedra.AAC.1